MYLPQQRQQTTATTAAATTTTTATTSCVTIRSIEGTLSGSEKLIEFVSRNQNVIKFLFKNAISKTIKNRTKSINWSINIDEKKVLTPRPQKLLASQIRNVI